MKNEQISFERWRRFLEDFGLIICAAYAGLVLYWSMFPAIYYMEWILWVPGLFLVSTLIFGLQTFAIWLVSRWKKVPFRLKRIPLALAVLPVLVTILFVGKIPLRASFLLAKPTLEKAVREHADGLEQVSRRADYHYSGLYAIKKAEHRCGRKDRIFFVFRDDHESGIIYSESGIDNLCYNEGSSGHLMGKWYWMKED